MEWINPTRRDYVPGTKIGPEETAAVTRWVNAVMAACKEEHVQFSMILREPVGRPGTLTYEISNVSFDGIVISHDVDLWNEHGRNCHRIVHKAILLAERIRPECIVLSEFAQRMVNSHQEGTPT